MRMHTRTGGAFIACALMVGCGSSGSASFGDSGTGTGSSSRDSAASARDASTSGHPSGFGKASRLAATVRPASAAVKPATDS